jgi:hypothetical protein
MSRVNSKVDFFQNLLKFFLVAIYSFMKGD